MFKPRPCNVVVIVLHYTAMQSNRLETVIVLIPTRKMLFTVVAAVFIASTRLHLCHAAATNSSPPRQTRIAVADECVQPHLHVTDVILSG